jgi:MFS family permease
VPADARRLIAAAFLRALAVGLSGVLLGVYLARLALSPGAIGLTVSAGLAGGALATLLATLGADRFGRRRFLVLSTALMAVGGVVLALTSSPVVLLATAFFGMANGMGRDRGAALVLDQAILPGVTTDAERTRLFAVYNVWQDVGHAGGGLLAMLPSLLRAAAGLDDLAALRVVFLLYAALLAAAALLYAGLSGQVEDGRFGAAPGARVTDAASLSPESRRLLVRISALFALDSLGGGFLTTSLLAFFFHERFGVDESVLGLLFFLARGANALSHLGAAWLARRIGLVRTMVFTHLPSSLLLLTVPFAPSFPVAALLFLVRESLVEMDVPTRQSYVMAVVRPAERTVASGVTHLVRLAAWAVAPAFAGAMMGTTLGAPLAIGAGLKIVYDVLLYRAFRGIKPPEER